MRTAVGSSVGARVSMLGDSTTAVPAVAGFAYESRPAVTSMTPTAVTSAGRSRVRSVVSRATTMLGEA
jgi:hypothetical protein